MTLIGPARGAARRLLVECLLGLGSRRVRLATLAAGAVDWRHLLDVAERHAIAEGVHLAMELHGATPPDGVRERLRDAHELAAARNSVLLNEAARVQGALAAEGIDSVLLKGTALVAMLPRRIGARHVGDIDLLVSPADLPRANRVASGLGCRLLAPVPAALEGPPPLPGARHHAPALVTPIGATLELHERPGHGRKTGEWTAAVLARATSVPWRGATLRIPSFADQLAILCEHAVEGHPGDRRLLPRHLGDLAMLAEAGSVEGAEVLPGSMPPIRWSLELLEAARLGRPVAARIFLRPGDPFRARLATLRTALAAQGGAWRLFVPSRDFMAARYGVSTRSARFPLLYLWRPARGAWRLFAGR